jgi:DNA-binding ferritin-like protein
VTFAPFLRNSGIDHFPPGMGQPPSGLHLDERDRLTFAPKQVEPPCLCDQLILLSSMLLALRDQSHLIHLNYTGRDFIAVHGWLKDRYEEHAEQFDSVAELVRIHGAMMPSTIKELRNCLPAFDDDACLCSYLNNITTLASVVNNLEKTAIEERAIDVADAMIDLAKSAGRTAWFIRMTIGADGET